MIKPEGSILKPDIRGSESKTTIQKIQSKDAHSAHSPPCISPYKKSQIESLNNIKSKLKFEVDLSSENNTENIDD